MSREQELVMWSVQSNNPPYKQWSFCLELGWHSAHSCRGCASLSPTSPPTTTNAMRLSGLQKEVLGLYRQCLRECRKKPEATRQNFQVFARYLANPAHSPPCRGSSALRMSKTKTQARVRQEHQDRQEGFCRHRVPAAQGPPPARDVLVARRQGRQEVI